MLQALLMKSDGARRCKCYKALDLHRYCISFIKGRLWHLLREESHTLFPKTAEQVVTI